MPKPKGVYVVKTLTYSCPNMSLCLEILEKVDEELSLEADLHAELKLDKLVFRIVGLEPNVQSAMARLREFLEVYASPKADPRKGVRADVIARYVKKSLPLDVLAVVVKKSLGVSAEFRGSTVYADVDLDTLLTVAKKVAEIHQRVEHANLSTGLKKLVVATMAIYNIDYNRVLEVLRDMQYLGENNELKAPWTRVLDEIEKFFEEAFTA